MSNSTDKRLIEDYIPIKLISREGSGEQSPVRMLHLWWARRPLVAARAAVFGALVPAGNTPEEKAALNDLMIRLCARKVGTAALEEAKSKIREAYPESSPKVLDMFAGGGSIPLEALRLGAETYALDLNPVAHIIELATLVYPQKYGQKLANDVLKWGEWVADHVKAEVGSLYPAISDPEYTQERTTSFSDQPKQEQMVLDDVVEDVDAETSETDEENDVTDAISTEIAIGYLQPIAYLWSRTVTCPNPACRSIVPLVRQTWLRKKKGDNVALEMQPHPTENRMTFHVRHVVNPKDFGFDPAGFSQRGNSVCGCCGTTVTGEYIKVEGKAKRLNAQLMAIVCVRAGVRGKLYFSSDDLGLPVVEDSTVLTRIEEFVRETGITPPDEEIFSGDSRAFFTHLYGLTRFSDLFTYRQLLVLLTFVKYVRAVYEQMIKSKTDEEYIRAVMTYLGAAIDRSAENLSTICRWNATAQKMQGTFGRQALPMVWDFCETNPFGGAVGDWLSIIKNGVTALNSASNSGTQYANVYRQTATEIPLPDASLTAIVTDPPYYDNVPYADLSDFFYVWLKRSIGFLYPEHFSSDVTPKKNEAIASTYRHKDKASQFYENMMEHAFREAHRTLVANGILVIVYAHKTTAGWSTLVDSMRQAGFYITEAWPLDTENKTRMRAQDSAALASSIFLVARKRNGDRTAIYSTDVLPETQRIVRERVSFFLSLGITGADLNIATVGAGLAPYTRYARVELPNGDELTAAAYLEAVQAEVVRVLLGEAANADKATQYYIIARENYGEAWVDFDEANNLARATGIELDTGATALTRGKSALIEKKGAKVRLRNFTERGSDESLGLPTPEHAKAPLIDVLHRLLWLAENDNSEIGQFMLSSQPDRHWLRVVAESLKGTVLASEPTPGAVRDDRTKEQRAIGILLASWRRIVDEGKMM